MVVSVGTVAICPYGYVDPGHLDSDRVKEAFKHALGKQREIRGARYEDDILSRVGGQDLAWIGEDDVSIGAGTGQPVLGTALDVGPSGPAGDCPTDVVHLKVFQRSSVGIG